jgi:hypothetical protein
MFKRLGVPILVLGATLTALTPSQALAERRHEERAYAPRQFHERHLRPHHRTDPFLTHDYWWRGHPTGYYDAWGISHPYRW